MQSATNRPQGMAAFVVIWAGQVISILASGMSGFALTLWIYTPNGQVLYFLRNPVCAYMWRSAAIFAAITHIWRSIIAQLIL
ncbi:MAG: hypothetical protein ACOYY3_01355, partial [Chloroflexota bacterium]